MRSHAAFLPPDARIKSALTKNAAEWRSKTVGVFVMRHIHLAEGLRLRFPGRNEDFDQGVEIGMLAVLMDLGERQFSRWISMQNRDQARALAQQLGYHVLEGASDSEWIEITFRSGPARPQLKLVHSVA
jgi:hypothetical protein